MSLTDDLRADAHEAGIDLVGCTSVAPFTVGTDRREVDPRAIMPEARSVVVTAFHVYGFEHIEPSEPGVPRGRFGPWTRASMPAVAHSEKAMVDFLTSRGFTARPVGDVPLKMAAVRSGIAQYGKNSILHADGLGSYIKLACVLTDAELECIDGPTDVSDCGDCSDCADACPTGALDTPYHLNWDRCICAWLWGRPVPREDRSKLGNLIHRCHYCQAACPKNEGLTPRASWPFALDGPTDSPELIPVLLGDEGEQRRLLPGFVMQAGPDTVRRNAASALGNVGDPVAVPALGATLGHDDPGVRVACAWALGRIGGPEAADALRNARQREAGEEVLAEIDSALSDAR